MNSAKLILLSLLFVSSVCVGVVTAQQPAVSTGTAVVAGRVSVEGGARAGVQLMLQREREGLELLNQAPPLAVVTDAEGNYRFTNVPAGKYRLQVYAPVYVNEQKDEPVNRGRPVNVAEGETIENLNFSLRRGGVITGKITDEENRPLIEEAIKLMRVDDRGKKLNQPAQPALPFAGSPNLTDDRGVYRLFGLEPGRYLVAAGAGQNETNLFGLSKDYQQTYHPRTTNEAEAKIIEVQPGVEVEGIDIVLVRNAARKGFAAAGRVIEAETGKPVAGVMIAYGSKGKSDNAVPFSVTPAATNSLGEFRLEGLAQGAYFANVLNLQAMTGGGTDLYAQPLDFEISGSDVGGLEIKMSQGLAISGSVALEGPPDPKLLSKLTGAIVQVVPENDSADQAARMASSLSFAIGTVKPDGTFRIGGVRTGKIRLIAQSLSDRTLKLVRMERNGAPVGELAINAADPINDLRLVFAFGSAGIVGRVEVRGGVLPPGTKISIMAAGQDAVDPARKMFFAQADGRGQFSLEGVVPGTYEVSVAAITLPDRTPVKSASSKQTVTVADNTRQEVVLNVELNPKEKDQ